MASGRTGPLFSVLEGADKIICKTDDVCLPHTAAAALKLCFQADFSGGKPEFCNFIITFNTDMMRLIPITSIEKRAKRANL